MTMVSASAMALTMGCIKLMAFGGVAVPQSIPSSGSCDSGKSKFPPETNGLVDNILIVGGM